jgi:L-proline---[L-prolyl-carrier protein] ligase
MSYNAIAERLMTLSPEGLRRNLFASGAGRLAYGDVREGMLAYGAWLTEVEGILPGDRVAICLPKNLETVQAIYGILAAGAAYVPLQFQGPPARLRLILASLQPKLLITTREMTTRLQAVNEPSLSRIRIVEIANEEIGLAALRGGIPALRTIAAVAPQSLAAIFFTSGSTGEPKGVMWSQRGMAASVASLPRWRQMTEHDRLISVSGLHYSASCEIFYPVASSAGVYLCGDHEAMFADRLAAVLEQDRTTIWSSTATGLRMLVEGGDLPARDLAALRRMEVFGERMQIAALRTAMAAVPQAEFHNLYAATEAFDMIEYRVPRPLGAEVTALPLGWPSPTYDLSLRDDAGEEVAEGQIGEICVAGPAVTMGYWNDPALSAAKRLAGRPDSYRTGDLATQGPDGLLKLVGRKDHLVKLRGHRFDLGEIEAAAKAQSRVREAVAFTIGTTGEEVEIVLAVLAEGPRDGRADLERALHRLCLERLPGFARPHRIVAFGEFPLLSSGKIDRRALEKLVAGK